MKELLLSEDSAANGCRNVAEVSALNIQLVFIGSFNFEAICASCWHSNDFSSH